MSDLLAVVGLGALLAGVAAIGWWLLVASEGVYLGRRVVVWLYDRFAQKYDGVKGYIREYEQMYLADPIMKAIAPQPDPLVLDVATGTGRLPLALNQHRAFEGFVIGVDLSREMLRYASRNIHPYDERAAFIWCPAEQLPFPDDCFDVVTCLEALEFMTQPEAVLRELARVLRPGGVLLITQRINTRMMPGKTWSSGQILELFEHSGIVDGQAQIWQVDYRKVWGTKAGDSLPTGALTLEDVLCCPRCPDSPMRRDGDQWRCEQCQGVAVTGKDGIIELFPLYR